jgi:hypothetical protein
MPRRYEIPSTPQNMVWGYLDSSTPHILEVSSGDTVTLHSFPSGGKETLPDDINLVPSDYLAALEMLPPGPGSHVITGPIYVRGAAVGDALQIDILDVKVRQDWGFVSILPLLGTLPDEFTDYETIHPRIDRQRNVCIMPWGSEIPLEPFFGIIATAPPPGWGRCGSPVPRAFGGNMDNKELRAGTTLYLPVFNEGALFFAGDGHAVQGDGDPDASPSAQCTATKDNTNGSRLDLGERVVVQTPTNINITSGVDGKRELCELNLKGRSAPKGGIADTVDNGPGRKAANDNNASSARTTSAHYKTTYPLKEMYERGELGINEIENRRHWSDAQRFKQVHADARGEPTNDTAHDDWRELLLEFYEGFFDNLVTTNKFMTAMSGAWFRKKVFHP